MANREHVKLLKQGVAIWNSWRQENPGISPNLIGTNLSYAHLNGANLRGADLRRAYLSGADLSDANLCQARLSYAYLSDVNLRNTLMSNSHLSGARLNNADLSGANLSGAHMIDTDLSGADLSHANLSKADLSRALLNGTHLSRANLSSAYLYSTTIANVDLREVKGLAEIDHRGPSHIELHTVKLPHDGGTALHFLRGAGIPEAWIALSYAEMMHPIQYHSCFISYSSKDETLARRLHADLQANGVRCWFAPEDMKIGDKIRARIDEAIHLQEKLLLLLSKHSLESNWVEDEVEAALEKEQRQQRDVLDLFPNPFPPAKLAS